MLNRKKREDITEENFYGAGRRKRNIEVPPPQKNYIFADDSVADEKYVEETVLTPEEQLEADFANYDWLEPTPIIRTATKNAESNDFEGLEVDDEEKLDFENSGNVIIEMLKREKLQYIAEEKEEEDMTDEEYENLFEDFDEDFSFHLESAENAEKTSFVETSPELHANTESNSFGAEDKNFDLQIGADSRFDLDVSNDIEISSCNSSEENVVKDEKNDFVVKGDELQEKHGTVAHAEILYSLSLFKDVSSVKTSTSGYVITEPDESENLFRPDDYINILNFERNVDPEDIHFQRKQFDFYGIEKNGSKYDLDTNKFAVALCKKLTAKIFNTQLFLYNKHRGIFEPITKKEFNKITYHILKNIANGIWKRNHQADYYEAFQHEIPEYSKFVYNRRYLSFNNCTLDLTTMTTQPHSPQLNSTNYLSYDYDPNATCPLWEKTLMQIFLGDIAVIESFREMFGCFLLHGKGKAMDKLFVLYGSGSNGKSLCTNVIKDVLTEKNCSAKSLNDIGKRFGLSTIYDKFLNISSENEKAITDTAIFKAVTSSDSVDIERKYQDSFSAVPYVNLVCSTNKVPKFYDDSNGMIRRMHVFTFNARFIDIENGQSLGQNEFLKDPLLFEKLHEERAGILNWALAGTQRLIANDYRFTMPPAIRRYNESFALNMNPVKIFLDSCIVEKPKNRIETPMVHSHYLAWAEIHLVKNKDFHGNQQFHRELKRLLLEKEMTDKVVQIKGYDYYCDFDVDTSYPLILPKCY